MLVNIEKQEMEILFDAVDLYISEHKGLSRGRAVGLFKEKLDRFKHDMENNLMGWRDDEKNYGLIQEFIENLNNPKRRRTK